MDFLRKVGSYIHRHFVPSKKNAYRPHLLRRGWLAFFLALILATEGFLVADLVARQSNQNFLAAVLPAEIIALTNTERSQNNVGQLAENAQLDAAAQAKANDMAANNYFSHIGPDGKTPWQWISQAGYQYQYAGENLAVRFVDSSDVVNAWMASPTHRENIVKPVYTQIGVGVAQGEFDGQIATYVVQYFGTPASVVSEQAAPPATASAPATLTQAAAAVQNAAPRVVAAVSAAPASPSGSQGASFTQSLVRQLMRALGDPQQTSNWILGVTAAILIIALVLTFVVHVQVQPSHLLVSGAFVVFVALSFIALNAGLAGRVPAGTQAAAAAQAGGGMQLSGGGVVIDAGAAASGYALFP